MSLYNRLGGADAIQAVVDTFYDGITRDPRLKHVFEDTDVDALKRHQRRFLAVAFGSGEPTQVDLRAAHSEVVRQHGIGDTHYDAVLAHLQRALEAHDVASELIKDALDIAESVRDEVLNR